MRILLGAIVLFGLSGCMVETATSTAIQSQNAAQGADAALKQKDAATGMLDKSQIKNAIQTYHAHNGYYPETLDDLVPDYLAKPARNADGTTPDYDPATGTVTF